MTKEEVRNIIKRRKCLITVDEKNEASSKLFTAIENSIVFKTSENILLYHSLQDEISTHLFIDKWCDKKNLFLPRVAGENLEILPYDRNLQEGAFFIKEPIGNKCTSISNIDLIIVPAVAIDRKGNRVGRGKGYYDRLLCQAKATKIGVIYDFQLFDEIYSDHHDIKMDFVVTPTEMIQIKNNLSTL